MKFFGDVKAVLDAFVGGFRDDCRNAAQKKIVQEPERFNEIEVPDFIKQKEKLLEETRARRELEARRSIDFIDVPAWIKKSN